MIYWRGNRKDIGCFFQNKIWQWKPEITKKLFWKCFWNSCIAVAQFLLSYCCLRKSFKIEMKMKLKTKINACFFQYFTWYSRASSEFPPIFLFSKQFGTFFDLLQLISVRYHTSTLMKKQHWLCQNLKRQETISSSSKLTKMEVFFLTLCVFFGEIDQKNWKQKKTWNYMMFMEFIFLFAFYSKSC